MDELIDKLGGPLCVAEMTGRKGFIGRYEPKNKPKYILRVSTNAVGTESVNVKEVGFFCRGCYILTFDIVLLLTWVLVVK